MLCLCAWLCSPVSQAAQTTPMWASVWHMLLHDTGVIRSWSYGTQVAPLTNIICCTIRLLHRCLSELLGAQDTTRMAYAVFSLELLIQFSRYVSISVKFKQRHYEIHDNNLFVWWPLVESFRNQAWSVIYSTFQREKDKCHNPQCSCAWRDSQLVLKDTQSPVGSLHVGLMEASFREIGTTLSVLHENQPVLDSQA